MNRDNDRSSAAIARFECGLTFGFVPIFAILNADGGVDVDDSPAWETLFHWASITTRAHKESKS